MPVDLEMLVSATPPLYAYSAFVDSRYTRFTSDGYCPTQTCDRGYSVHGSNFFNDHGINPHLQYSEIGSSFSNGTQFKVNNTDEDITNSRSEAFSCSYTEPHNKLREKKRVSFADDKGLALVEVRSIPNSPHSTPKWTHNFFSFITGGIKPKIDLPSEKKWKVAFTNPPHNLTSLSEKLRSSFVALQSVDVEERGTQDVVKGTIKVRNTSFKKEVFLRITFDRWVSHEDVEGTYRENVTPEGEDYELSMEDCDTFTFSVVVPPSALRYEVVEFCVCYRMEDREFWDNNGGINYRLVTVLVEKTPNVTREMPQILPDSRPIPPRFTPITEHFATCPRIDAWETLLNEQPYW